MGCSKFGERWDKEADNLMVEAYTEAIADAGIDTKQIDAAWLATAIEEQHVGKSATPLAQALRLPFIPVTRVENYCASGTEAFRGAVYAVASGAADVALALGVEKLKDTGYGGLPQRGRGPLNDMTNPNASAPGSFAQLAAAYRAKHNIEPKDLKQAHGAHLGQEPRQRLAATPRRTCATRSPSTPCSTRPPSPSRWACYDCCGVSDGAACAIVATPEVARGLGKKDMISIKALQVAVSNGLEAQHNSWDGSYFATTRIASKRAYDEAGIDKPREQLSLIEVHDCFSVTELVTMEDLHISPEGGAIKDVLDGFYDADGKMPCQIDGGLKCFGHPIGASGLRMIYEMYLQMQGRAGERQRKEEPVLRPHPQPRRLPAAQRRAISIVGRVRGVNQSRRSCAAFATSSWGDGSG